MSNSNTNEDKSKNISKKIDLGKEIEDKMKNTMKEITNNFFYELQKKVSPEVFNYVFTQIEYKIFEDVEQNIVNDIRFATESHLKNIRWEKKNE